MRVEQRVGTVAELHALDPFGGDVPVAPSVWWCRPTDDAIVLGSRQHPELVDAEACRRAELSIVRRRSGGGAVLLRRNSILWVDAVLPTGVAPDDVRGSMVWIGECWRDVLETPATGGLTVHDGAMQTSAWSELVCFAGVGPGEVMTGAGKLVGLSQRRTRHGIRVQALIYGESVTHDYRSIMRGDLPDDDPSGQAWLAELDHGAVVEAFARRITPL